MKRLMIRLCLSVAIVVGTLSAFQKPSVVQGQVPEPPNSLEPINVPSPDTVQQLEILRSKKEKYELAISRIEQHLLQELDGTLRITVESAEQLGIEPSTFDELTQSLSTTNEWIRQGIIRPEQVKLKTDFSTIPNSLSRSRYMTFECAGRSGTEYHW